MKKGGKSLYIVGSIAVGVCSLLIILFGVLLFSDFDKTDNELIFTSDTREFIYDGSPHSAKSWKLSSGRLKNGHRASVNVYGSQTAVGASENSFSVDILDGNGKDVTDTYTVTLQAGEIKVNPRPLKITTASAEKFYDGYPLSDGGWSVSSGGLVNGDYLDVDVTGEQKGIGYSQNFASAAVRDRSGADVTGNYALEIEEGVLTINAIPVEISTSSAVKVYDGEPFSCAEWTLNSTLREGDKIESVTMPASITERGAVENYVSEVIIKTADGKIADYYRINCTAGTLAVTPRIITVRSGDAAKDYDGLPLTCDKWDLVSIIKPADGQTLSVSVSGTRTQPGESRNVISGAVVLDGSGKDVTSNYEINYQEGALVVRGDGKSAGNGSGNPVGSGGASLDTGGNIGGGVSETQTVALRVYSDDDGKAYLKLKSFGDCTGGRWLDAAEYTPLISGKYSANYLAGVSLASAGVKRTHMRLESLSGDYPLPVYPDASGGDYAIQTSDTENLGDTSKVYSLNCYLYDGIPNGKIASDPAIYGDYERAYYNFVLGEYLALSAGDYGYFTALAAENGLSAADPDIIAKVAAFIRGAAKYNADYNRALDGEPSVAVSFLSDYKEGVCRHFASAATLLFRALGIPARYAIGYAGTVKAGEWTDFTGADAHAWVEVYIKGFGWATVEVTGAAPSGDLREKLEIKPADLSQKYDGTVLTHSGEVQGLSALSARGYTYRAEISGRQTTVGASECKIVSFSLFDERGNDVTANYNIVCSSGRLQLYLDEITVYTDGASKNYDGTALTSDGISYGGSLMAGHQVRVLKATGSRTAVGKSLNTFYIKITDGHGADVTDAYKINGVYGVLEIDPAGLLIEVFSDTKKYDGLPLTCNLYVATFLTVNTGDKIEVFISGSQTAVGYSDNVATRIIITNAEGEDVTSNYAITVLNGTLTVLP